MGNEPLLQQISNRLSNAGGSYPLQFRNPNELLNILILVVQVSDLE